MLKINIYTTVLMIFMASVAKADVNVAVIAPQEGEYQAFGEEIISGVLIAVNGINEAGGLKGEKINLITVDDRCDDRLAVSTAQMMSVNNSKTDRISLVIGPYCSNAFDEVANIYAKANIFQIIPTTISARNNNKKHRGLVKMVGYKDRQSVDFYKYYKNNFDGKKVAIVYDSEDKEVVSVGASLQQEFKKHNQLDKLKAYNYRSYDNLDELANSIVEENISIAYVMGSPKRIAKISHRLKSDNGNFIIFTSKYKEQEDYNEIMGDLAEGTYYLGLPSLKDNPNFAETLVQLRLLGIEPEGLGVYGFSAMKLWEELVRKSASFRYEKVAEALNNGAVETPWGETMFNNGSPENSVNYGIYLKQNGQYTQVY